MSDNPSLSQLHAFFRSLDHQHHPSRELCNPITISEYLPRVGGMYEVHLGWPQSVNTSGTAPLCPSVIAMSSKAPLPMVQLNSSGRT